MIPITDNVPRRRFPVTTITLIGMNILLFFVELGQGRALNEFIYMFGLIPRRFVDGLAVLEFDTTLITSLFLHGNWLHLIGNMLFLWIFGDNIEGYLGTTRFLLLYLLGGIAASLAHISAFPESTTPIIGASGAIAAVQGAYLVLYPHARIKTLLLLGFFVTIVEIPAVFFLGIWFLIQLASGIMAVTPGFDIGGVAWWAHIGGFTSGIILVRGLHTPSTR